MTDDAAVDNEQFKARPYQEQLIEVVMQQNSIIYLPTGAGKTFIALMAIKRLSNDLSKSLKDGGKRSVFLVNTVVLAHQQVECIRKATALDVAVYTGDMNVDAWRLDRWANEFEKHQVIVATCQIVLDVLRHGYIGLEHLNLIIFDECHHGRKDHPMHQLMSHYRHVAVAQRPRIIGLTGMLIGASVKPENVISELDDLEGTFHASIVTVKTMKEFTNVLVFSTNPKETIIRYHNQMGSDAMQTIQRITDIVNKMVELIEAWPVDITHQNMSSYTMHGELTNATKFLRTIVQDFVYQMNDMGIYGASISIMSLIVDLEFKKRGADSHRLKQLVRQLITGCELIRHILVEEMDEDEAEEDDATILTNASPKLLSLIAFLKRYVRENDATKMKAIVFVQRRYTAKMIYHVLTRYAKSDAKNFNIVPDFMVGTNNQIPESVDCILETKRIRSVVEKFRKNEINLIVASSVLEEGIDLQMCNLVLCYDTPMSFRSYVQTKGRARMSTSCYAIMTATSDFNRLANKLVEYRQIDSILKEYLVGRTIDREGPLPECINSQFDDEQIKPFRTRIGAVLEATSSVQLLNRYCMTLPNDCFTMQTVTWKKLVSEDGKTTTVVIRLPMQSKVKQEIRSDPVESLKLAKRSAAFKACVLLYECGELNDHLMPINAKRCMQAMNLQYFKHWSKYSADNAKMAGTKRTIRLHSIVFPDVLTASTPIPNQKCYLYTMIVRPEFPVQSDESAEKFRHLLASQNTFGILTAQKLPNLGRISLYLTMGQVDVTVAAQPVEVVLTDAQHHLHRLRNFHCMVFRDILQIDHPFLASDFSNGPNSVVVVPCAGNAIDWNVVDAFQRLEPSRRLEAQEARNMHFQPQDYLHKVVRSTYRNDFDTCYIVTKVLVNESPSSAFPDDNKCATYADYYLAKYGLTVANPKQFLIEVKAATTRLNRLAAGGNEDGGKNVESIRMVLIPELCHNFGFPGDLWLKATLLPSILHRMHFLLHAEKMRVKINRYIGIDDSNYMPEPVAETVRSPNRTTLPSANQNGNIADTISPRPVNVLPKTVQPVQGVIACPWLDYEEPIDWTRKLQEIYTVDIDYYDNFVKNELENVSDALNRMRLGAASVVPVELPAVDMEKQKIKLLYIDLKTPTMGPRQCDLLACLTAKTSGDIIDLERLEVIGDAFLKFGVSLFLLQQHPDWHEGFLTSCKGQMVSNRNLCYIAMDRNLAGYMKVDGFKPKSNWAPPLLNVPSDIKKCIDELNVSPQNLFKVKLTPSEVQTGNVEAATIRNFLQMLANVDPVNNDYSTPMFNLIGKQRVSDKSLADCVEAIIGACVTRIGLERGFKLLSMLDIFPSAVDHTHMLQKAYSQPRLRASIKDSEVDTHLINHANLETNLGYKFKDRAYLLQALTHPSFPTNTLTGCYQQLEFLGDAVLDMLITAYIYENCPNEDPGKLTDIRSALVNNITLACLCVRYNFHLHILHQNAILAEKIADFVQFQTTHAHSITDQVLLLLSDRDVMGDFVDVPKTLGDIFEALIGAVFLDSGNNLLRTWSVIYRLMQREIAAFMVQPPLQIVRQLYEYPNAVPTFDEPYVDGEIVMINVRFTCRNELMQAQGFGSNKENAKRAAAKVALSKLKAQ